MAVAAVIADYHILTRDVGENANRVGFLSQAGVSGAVEDAGRKFFQQQGFKSSDGVKLFVKLRVLIHLCPLD